MGTVAVTGKPGNYLRVRGEYSTVKRKPFPKSELPPRARRIQQVRVRPRGLVGTTSACAENTPQRFHEPFG